MYCCCRLRWLLPRVILVQPVLHPQVPQPVWMRIGAETRSWALGKANFLDDSFEHEVPSLPFPREAVAFGRSALSLSLFALTTVSHSA